MAQIVDGVGVAKGVFYWYFDSKEQLFYSLLDETRRDVGAAQQAALRRETDPLARIEVYLRSTIEWTSKNAERGRLFGAAEADPHLRMRRDTGRAKARRQLEGLIRDAMDSGALPPGDVALAAAFAMGILMTLNRYLDDDYPPDEIADAIVGYTLGGLTGGAKQVGVSRPRREPSS